MLISPTTQRLAEAVKDNIATHSAFAIVLEQLTSQLLLVLRAIVFLLFLFFLFLFVSI